MRSKTSESSCNIFLFRRDLRLDDNPGLIYAVQQKKPLVLLYIYDEKNLVLGASSGKYIEMALEGLREKVGGKLMIRRGCTWEVLVDICKKMKVSKIIANETPDPLLTNSLLFTPRSIQRKIHLINNDTIDYAKIALKRKGKSHYIISKAFFRKILKTQAIKEPTDFPLSKEQLMEKLTLPSHYQYEPLKIDPLYMNVNYEYWQKKIKDPVTDLMEWFALCAARYGKNKTNILGCYASEKSQQMAQGILSRRRALQITSLYQKHFTEDKEEADSMAVAGTERFLRNMLWGEFATYYLAWNPNMWHMSLVPKQTDQQIELNEKGYLAWCRGQTGCQVVDMAITLLISTGAINNRLRLIAASYLVHILRVPWQYGARFFERHLLDADLASNCFNWQWVATTLRATSTIRKITKFDNKMEEVDPDGSVRQMCLKPRYHSQVEGYRQLTLKEIIAEFTLPLPLKK